MDICFEPPLAYELVVLTEEQLSIAGLEINLLIGLQSASVDEFLL